jgi:hypothetical protein
MAHQKIALARIFLYSGETFFTMPTAQLEILLSYDFKVIGRLSSESNVIARARCGERWPGEELKRRHEPVKTRAQNAKALNRS